jgi:hypothetical protein
MRQVDAAAVRAIIQDLSRRSDKRVEIDREALLNVLTSLTHALALDELKIVPEGSFLLVDKQGMSMVQVVPEETIQNSAGHYRRFLKLGSFMEDFHALVNKAESLKKQMTAVSAAGIKEYQSNVRRVYMMVHTLVTKEKDNA